VLLFSDQTFEELASRLMRVKFDRYVETSLRRQFLADIASIADWVGIEGNVRACRDPNDDMFLETAVVGEAECIITGDGDLLALDPFFAVRIIPPREFLAVIASDDDGLS
jgi:putative PIN family toxin of toxin-antitoxin system